MVGVRPAYRRPLMPDSMAALLLTGAVVTAELALGCSPAESNLAGMSDAVPRPRLPDAEFADTDRSALSTFREVLSPHGTWEEDPRLGTVWVPSEAAAGPGFIPYVTSGRWGFRGGEYVWISELPWGWVPFHYGRWAYAGDGRWAWVPGRRYAGAWVVWRTGRPTEGGPRGLGVVGWGPEPPAWLWHRGEALAIAPPVAAPFVYCPLTHLFDADVGTRVLPMGQAVAVSARTLVHGDAQDALAAGRHYRHAPPAPAPSTLGFNPWEVPAPAPGLPGEERALLLAKPATAEAAGERPSVLFPASRLRTFVIGGPRYRVGDQRASR